MTREGKKRASRCNLERFRGNGKRDELISTRRVDIEIRSEERTSSRIEFDSGKQRRREACISDRKRLEKGRESWTHPTRFASQTVKIASRHSTANRALFSTDPP